MGKGVMQNQNRANHLLLHLQTPLLQQVRTCCQYCKCARGWWKTRRQKLRKKSHNYLELCRRWDCSDYCRTCRVLCVPKESDQKDSPRILEFLKLIRPGLQESRIRRIPKSERTKATSTVEFVLNKTRILKRGAE